MGIGRRRVVQAGAGAVTAALLPTTLRGASATATDDISLLREILVTLHPGLYRYSSPKKVDSDLMQLGKTWTASPELSSRYLNLSHFLASIKCGHSYANFFNQTQAVKDQLFSGPTRLPFAFKWIGSDMVVLRDQSGMTSLPRGTIITSVNGVRPRDILARMMPYVRADGNNDGKRRALLSMTGADEIETFDVFHGLLYGPPANGLHRLHIRLPQDARETKLEVPALTLAQRQAFITAPDYRGADAVWQWTMRPDGIAVLRMDSWGLYNSSWDWSAWLNDRLDSLNGAKGLIVDIRENEGGLDCGDIILARIAGRDIYKPQAERLVRYAKTPAHLNTYLDTWDNDFRDWKNQIAAKDARFFRLTGGTAARISGAGLKKLSVPMAVLITAQNSSATFQFASLTQQLRLGTLVGETTGGNQRGINGGAFFFARLPESGIEFDVPLIGYFPAGRAPDAGITPDIKVALTADAIAVDADPQMQAAVRHLLRA